MASKKYIIQPLTPPRQRKSSALSILAKYANSTGRSNESKKRESELSAPTLPFSPYTPSYDLPEYNGQSHYRPTESSLREGQHPHDLEADLKFYREYCHKERESEALDEHHDGRDDGTGEDEEGQDTDTQPSESVPDNVDFASWRREMNSRLATKRRQIRSEKRRARKEVAPTPPPPASTPPPQKPKISIFQLGKSKPKKEEPEPSSDSRFMPMHNLIIPLKEKEEMKASKSFTRNHKKSASESIVDPRLFQTVRTPSSIEEEEAANINMSKSKSLSPRSYSPTPAAKMSPRKGSPAKISPRNGSPAKVSPRKGSPAKVSPRRCSPPRLSPRGYTASAPTTPTSSSIPPAFSDQYNFNVLNISNHTTNNSSSNNTNNTTNNTNNTTTNINTPRGDSSGKRTPRNAFSLAIAT